MTASSSADYKSRFYHIYRDPDVKTISIAKPSRLIRCPIW